MNNKFDNTKVKELNEKNYKINKESVKIENKNKKPGIVVFYYYWCGYCSLIAPELLKLAEKNNVNVYAIHGENPSNKSVFEILQIQGVPHIRFVKESGLITKTYQGDRIMKELYKFIQKNKKQQKGGSSKNKKINIKKLKIKIEELYEKFEDLQNQFEETKDEEIEEEMLDTEAEMEYLIKKYLRNDGEFKNLKGISSVAKESFYKQKGGLKKNKKKNKKGKKVQKK